MRNDHNKLICERERRGNYVKYHHIRHLKEDAAINDAEWDLEHWDDIDDEIQTSSRATSMTKEYRSRWKDSEFNDFGTPIRGFVHKNVGRKWDDIFSEFCAQYDRRAIINKHLFRHLLDIVERKVIIIDDELHIRSRWRCETLKEAYVDYYVDPRDGILKRNPDARYWKQVRREREKEMADEKAKTIRVVDKLTEHHLINGTWFEVKFVERIGARKLTNYTNYYRKRVTGYYVTEYPYQYDVVLKKNVDTKRVAISKRTLSKNELRDYGIKKAA